MKTRWNSTNYGNDLKITLRDAESCSHAGQCDEDVKILMDKPYIKKQLKNINPEQLKKELNDFGAWDEDELNNHEDNLMRWVWISAGDIIDGKP
jgi:hypothetical protein